MWSSSRRCSSNLRGRSGSWFSRDAGSYGGMWTECSHSSPSRTAGISVLQLRARGAQRLDLGALQRDPALEPLEQLVAMRCVAVGGHVAGPDLALCLALRHRLEPSRRAPGRRGRALRRLAARAPAAGRRGAPPSRCADREEWSPARRAPPRSRPPSALVRSRRTGSMPSNGGEEPSSAAAGASSAAGENATNAPAEIRPVTSPAKGSRGPARRAAATARSSARCHRRHAPGASRRARGPRSTPASSAISPARGAVSPAPSADSSARWHTRSG